MQKTNAENFVEEIIQIYNTGCRKPRNTPELKKRFNDQVAYEEAYKEKSRICHVDGTGFFSSKTAADLTGVHVDQLTDQLKYRFFDYNVMTEMRCMMNLIIDIKDNNGESERSRIHRFIDNPKRFGADSAYNYAMRTDLDSDGKTHDSFKGEMVVIKCPREPSSAKELIHELCVGIRLSELRKYSCSNFSMVYDAWDCSAPVVNDDTNEVINWCMASKNPVSYVAYEMIHNPREMNTVARDRSPDVHLKMAQYLMQMAQAERLASLLCGFQHYDAHGGNVLLRPFHFSRENDSGRLEPAKMEPFYVYYDYNGVKSFVPTPGEIVTFIDYGMSRCVMEDGTIVGKLNASGSQINTKVADPYEGDVLGDIYKMICAILIQSFHFDNDNLIIFLGNLLNEFFYKDAEINWDVIRGTLESQSDIVFLLPPSMIKERGLKIDDFINLLRDLTMHFYNFELLYTEDRLPKDAKIFGYLPKFEDYKELEKEIGFTVSKVPTLFDLSDAITNESDRVDILKTNIMKHFGEVIHNERSSITSLIHAPKPSSFYPLDTGRRAIEDENYEAIRNIEEVAVVANICYELTEKLKVYRSCKEKLDHVELTKLISECQIRLREFTTYIEKIKVQLMANMKHIKNAMKEPRTDKEEVDPLFNLSDKYEKTISALRNIRITL